MATITQQQQGTSLDKLEDGIEYALKFVTIISELVLLIGLGYAGFKLAHKGPTPDILDQIWLVSQVIALDLSAPGLFAMAKQARDNGDEKRAAWATRIAVILIIMSILTMAEGAITSYLSNIPEDVTKYVTLAMMIIRGGASVGYSVFRRLQKEDRIALVPTSPTQPPTPPTQPSTSPTVDAYVDERIAALENKFDRLLDVLQMMQQRQPSTLPTYITVEPSTVGDVDASTSNACSIDAPTVGDVDGNVGDVDESDTSACEASVADYPVIAGMQEETVKRVIDAYLNGTKWHKIPGNYSQTIKPIREAWEHLHNEISPAIEDM